MARFRPRELAVLPWTTLSLRLERKGVHHVCANVGSSMTSLEDLSCFVVQDLGGSIIRRDQDSLRAHLVYNGRSVEVSAKSSRKGVIVARSCGSVPAFTYFCEKFRDFAARRKELPFDPWNDTEVICRALRAGGKVSAERWRSHLHRAGIEEALPMTPEGCEKVFQVLAETHAQRVFDDARS